MKLSPLIAVFCLVPVLSSQAQVRTPEVIYSTFCFSCHGAKFEGGMGGSLVAGPWKHGNTEAALAASIANGYPGTEMPAWKAVLSEAEIRGVARMIAGKIKATPKAASDLPPPAENRVTGGKMADGVVNRSELQNFKIGTYVDGLKEPWGMAFLPDGRALVAERVGTLLLIDKTGKLPPIPVKNVPEHDVAVGAGAQAGLFDVKLHPDFAKNGFIYLSFANAQTAPAGFKANLTRVIRARLVGDALVDIKDIYVAATPVDYGTNGNFGGRMTFDAKGYLYLSIGDRGQRQTAQAQLLNLPTGKIHRFHDDGRIPEDNPFVKTPGAIPSIWAYGVRNPQGLCIEPVSGLLWETEHGMKGGDELNLIRKGVNYGWPLATRGTDYGGKPPEGTLNGQHYVAVTDKEGLEPPVLDWTPSIAVCGINFYSGDLFPKWKGNLFVCSLAKQQFQRLEIRDQKVVHQEVIFSGLGRLRYVLTGPDGALYVLHPTRITRITP